MYLYEDSLVQAAKQETEGGSRIVQFLMGAMYADHPKFGPSHQISAARILTEIGSKEAGVFMRLHKPIRPKRARAAAVQATDDAAQGPLDPELAAIVAQETDGGITAVRFLIDVMEDNFPDLRKRHRFTPWQRLSACRELIRIGFIKHIPDKTLPPRPKDAIRHRRAQDAAIAKRNWNSGEFAMPTPTEVAAYEAAVRDANRAHPKLRDSQFRESVVEARVTVRETPQDHSPLAINMLRVDKETLDRSREIAGPNIYDKTLDAIPPEEPAPLRHEAPDPNPPAIVFVPINPNQQPLAQQTDIAAANPDAILKTNPDAILETNAIADASTNPFQTNPNNQPDSPAPNPSIADIAPANEQPAAVNTDSADFPPNKQPLAQQPDIPDSAPAAIPETDVPANQPAAASARATNRPKTAIPNTNGAASPPVNKPAAAINPDIAPASAPAANRPKTAIPNTNGAASPPVNEPAASTETQPAQTDSAPANELVAPAPYDYAYEYPDPPKPEPHDCEPTYPEPEPPAPSRLTPAEQQLVAAIQQARADDDARELAPNKPAAAEPYDYSCEYPDPPKSEPHDRAREYPEPHDCEPHDCEPQDSEPPALSRLTPAEQQLVAAIQQARADARADAATRSPYYEDEYVPSYPDPEPEPDDPTPADSDAGQPPAPQTPYEPAYTQIPYPHGHTLHDDNALILSAKAADPNPYADEPAYMNPQIARAIAYQDALKEGRGAYAASNAAYAAAHRAKQVSDAIHRRIAAGLIPLPQDPHNPLP